MLFAGRPSDIFEAELMPMKHFPFKGYKYMMWCGRIIYRKENEEKVKKRNRHRSRPAEHPTRNPPPALGRKPRPQLVGALLLALLH